MEYIASGAQADIYRDGSHAIKIFNNTFNKQEVEYEAHLQKMAFDCGLPVPEVFDIITIDNKFGLVMEFIEGTPVGKIIQDDHSKLDEYLTKSIEIQNFTHTIEAHHFPLMKDKHRNHISNASLLNKKEKDIILQKLENTEYDTKLCHGDFHVSNLIQTSNGIKIIDWICAGSGSPYADIYRTYLLAKIYIGEFAEIYLNTYCKIVVINKTELFSWALITAAARLGEYTRDENEQKALREIIENEIIKI